MTCRFLRDLVEVVFWIFQIIRSYFEAVALQSMNVAARVNFVVMGINFMKRWHQLELLLNFLYFI